MHGLIHELKDMCVYCGVAWTAGNQEDVTQAEKGKEKQAEEGSRYG